MILLSIIILLASTLFQGIISNYIGYAYINLSIFSTIYVLIALLILAPYFENKKKYFTLLIVFGLILDFTYTNTFILNTSLFIISYYISKVFHSIFPYNLLTISVSNLLCIFLYHIISFIFLNISGYSIYNFIALAKILTHSILMTIIYSCITYVLIALIFKKFQLKEVK